MYKILAGAITSVIAILLFFGFASLQDKSKIKELEQSPDRGKLSWRAQLAKAKGEDNVLVGSTVVDYAVPRSLEEALSNYSLVVAEPLYSQSIATTYEIQTWYKFRLIEELSAPATNCQDCGAITPPEDLMPLQPNEFVSAKVGGETTVEGIRITSSDPKFPKFEIGKRYLLLVAFDAKRVVGALRTGPWGAFVLNSDDRFEPIDSRLKHPLRDKLAEQFGNSLSNLRHGVKARN